MHVNSHIHIKDNYSTCHQFVNLLKFYLTSTQKRGPDISTEALFEFFVPIILETQSLISSLRCAI